MKQQDKDQLRQKSKLELAKDAAEARRELVSLRMQKGQQALPNVRQEGALRKKLAVLQTLIGQKD